jgi:hypothetical protein
VKLEGNRLTVILNQLPLQVVLQEIARQTGLRIVPRSPLEDRLSLSFANVPLEDGLRRLLGPHHAVFLYRPTGELQEVRVHAVSWQTEPPPATPSGPTETVPAEPLAGLPALTDLDPVRRLATASALAGTEDSEAALEAVLDLVIFSTQPDLRERALGVLTLFRNVPVAVIAEVARVDPEPSLRWSAAGLLGRLAEHDPAARTALREIADAELEEAVWTEVQTLLNRVEGAFED